MAKSRDFTKRTNLRVPQGLIEIVHDLAGRHIPPANKTEFYAHIIKRGLDAWDEGKQTLDKPNQFLFQGSDAEQGKFQHYVEKTLIDRFNLLANAQDPKPLKQRFFTHIVCLGVESYQADYDEFGVKRD